MKRAQAKVIGSPFLKFYKGTHDLHDIDAAQYLLYGVLWDQNKNRCVRNLRHFKLQKTRQIGFKCPNQY